VRSLGKDDQDYPERLRSLPRPPSPLWVDGELSGGVRVAIVGSRQPIDAARRYASDLAAAVASAGGVVVSGGALGVDGSAHEGALRGGGATWAVLPCGHNRSFPAEHEGLFAQIPRRGGATLSALAPDQPAALGAFHRRNGILVALSDVVVIVQAGLHSGTRNAAAWARKLKRPLWVVPAPPWMEGFEGCAEELEWGANPLLSTERFLASVSLAYGQLSLGLPSIRENSNENKVLTCIGASGIHVDEIVDRSGLSVAEATTALLTLSLEDVVVEGPERCFRRGPGR
jgi:DNA processing protein